MDKQPKPFDCSYTPQFAELLTKLGVSLAISTYQAGKVVLISAVDTDKLIQLPRTFENAMGMATGNNKLAVSTGNEVVVLKNFPELASSYPSKKNVYDGIYIPSTRYNTGYLSLHDMAFLNDKLIAVNTLFSCLSYIDGNYSFTPFWQPEFITQLRPEDRCHLNGIATSKNEIKYLTALGNSNTVQGWRDKKMNGGILMEYPSGKIILEGLSMPHSPRIYNGKLYILNSAQGELICVEPDKKSYEVIVQLGGFARGMARFGDYLFIGVSKLRHNSAAFRDLGIAKTSFAGVIAVYLPYKSIVGSFRYEMSVDEIYDVKVIENSIHPTIISPEMPIHGQAITTPIGSFWSNPVAKKTSTHLQNSGTKQQASVQNAKQIAFQIERETTGNKLAEQLPELLFPLFLKKLQNENLERKLLAIKALYNNKPVALLVSEIYPNNTAVLHSVFVAEKFRKKGIATELLKQNDKLLIDNKIKSIDVSWADIIQEARAFEKLIQKNNWLPHQRTILNVKLNVDKALQAKWKNKIRDTENNIEVIDWERLTEPDIQEIHSIIQENRFPKYLTPFQLPEILDTKISKALRVNGEMCGWCIFHKIKSDTIQCSSLYIKNEHRGKLKSMKLLASCFIDAQKEQITYIMYQTKYQDQSLIRYLDTLTVRNSVVKKYNLLASRKYYSANENTISS